MRIPDLVTPELQERTNGVGRILALAGGAIVILAPFLPWAYGQSALDNMTVLGYPSPMQFLSMVLGILVVGLLVGSHFQPKKKRKRRIGWVRGAKSAATGALVYIVLIIISIAVELEGLVNVEYGGWVALIGALAAFVGTKLMLADRAPNLGTMVTRPWIEILAIAAMMGLALFGVAFALNMDDGGSFVSFLGFIGAIIAVLSTTGVMAFLSGCTQRHRRVLILSAFVVAFAFPFTQDGSDANMSIATQVIIFAGTAMGLNIVVGLAGLLDLGYIAFLGAGAFTAAILSESAFSTVDWHPPFIVVMLISGCVAASLGLLIGSPTLRVSRRLPGHRHARLRGDLPDLHEQPGRERRAQPDQRFRRHPRHSGSRAARLRLRRDRTFCSVSRWVGSPTTTSCCCSCSG